MVSSIVFWGSVIMFPRTYWFLCTKTLQTMYVVGKWAPVLIKKIIQDKRNALEPSEGQDNTPTSNGL